MKNGIVFLCIFLTQIAFAQGEVAEVTISPEQEVNQAVSLANEVANEGNKSLVTETTAKLSEDQIALNLETKKTAANHPSSALNFILGFSILGIMISGGFFFLRKYSIPKQSRHQTQIKVLQQHYLGPKKSLAIVSVAGESILLGITDHTITHLRTLSLLDDEVPVETPDKFQGVLGSMTGTASFDDADEEQDQFAIRGIRDVVSTKLKGMRSL